jgi:CubicO group peptidase (beta-lactamase class C family)
MNNGEFSGARLGRMRGVMAGHVEGGAVPGIVTLVSRRDEVHVDAIGMKAFGGSDPMRRDTIFRIASVTKPIVAAAAMVLVEECALRLDEPVDLRLPELADRKVLRAIDSPLEDTVPANRPITLRDLLTFRLGIGAVMVFPPRYPIQQAMTEAGVGPGPALPAHSPDELMKRFGSLPLVHQPGERWLYNSGSDILPGRPDLARRRHEPRGVPAGADLRAAGHNDTSFSVPERKPDRLASSYWTNPSTGEFEVFDGVDDSRWASPPVFESGAGGLVSTVDDLLSFGQMMLKGGKHRNERILSRRSVELMTTDHITPEQKEVSGFFPGFWDDHGWGFGVSIMTRRDDLAATPGRYGWDGGYGTSWYVDPEEELIGILMTQRVWDSPSPPGVLLDFWTSAYQAIDE